MKGTGMKIGTLSFAIQNAAKDEKAQNPILTDEKIMVLSGEERVEIIKNTLKNHKPDFLLTAGYSLEEKQNLDDLGEYLKKEKWQGLVFVEVKHWPDNDQEHPRQIPGITKQLASHCLFVWDPEKQGWKNMGRQYFATHTEAKGLTRITAFAGHRTNRTIEFSGRRVGALICGEINILHTKKGNMENVQVREPRGETSNQEWLESLDIIVNPTHDLMERAAELQQKRKWSSRENTVYVHASNSNIRKRVGKTNTSRCQPQSDVMHSVYQNQIKIDRQGKTKGQYEYRETII